MSVTQERWRPTGYEPYWVSDSGKVYGRKILNPWFSRGYPAVNLYSTNCGRKTITIHLLVARAFLGHQKKGMEVNHKDGNKLNNHISNLEYVTPKQNQSHSRRVLGNACNAKLSVEIVLQIRHLCKKHSQSEVSRMLGLSVSIINRVFRRKTWKWVKKAQ